MVEGMRRPWAPQPLEGFMHLPNEPREGPLRRARSVAGVCDSLLREAGPLTSEGKDRVAASLRSLHRSGYRWGPWAVGAPDDDVTH